MRKLQDMTLFFGAEDALSNWHPANFEFRGVRFTCVEQFMMYSKAMLFKDADTAEKVLQTHDPRTQKKLGREVRGFDESVWVCKREAIVTVACREKFQQNTHLATQLIATGSTLLVEASPYDRIWGVGLAWNDQRILDPNRWLGMNLLGKALMNVRAQLNSNHIA